MKRWLEREANDSFETENKICWVSESKMSIYRRWYTKEQCFNHFLFLFFYFLFMFLRPFIKIEEKDINFHWILDYFWNLFSFMVKIMKPNLIFQKFIHLFLFLSLCWHIIILAILLISCCCQMIFLFYFETKVRK